MTKYIDRQGLNGALRLSEVAVSELRSFLNLFWWKTGSARHSASFALTPFLIIDPNFGQILGRLVSTFFSFSGHYISFHQLLKI